MERLCDEGDIPEQGGIAVAHAGRAILLVRADGHIHAYDDLCPHMKLSLRWPPAPFVTADGRHIACANHNAYFRAADGMCVAGPCKGDRLTRRTIRIENGAVWLSAAE